MSSGLMLRASLAQTLATEGVAVTIRRMTPGAYDPVTGTSGAATTQDFTGRGRIGFYAARHIDGVRVMATDRQITFQPTDWSFEPLPTDKVIAPETLAIVSPVRKRELGGTPFSYTLQVRNAGP